ncbi:futalosine hydrolase [Chitinophaga pendula]|uniref:futalosine hydrolase n=1 Tax=Chitinophaga TaxID=79328 RepID=UPI000BAE90E4|nr:MULTISPECIES: futalosine hydrolase [Chitinophaga]ASZ14698.1 futalosine hydrolase [Chitinophaga sp. MD30]UCJ07644.1 futalosine hydrolase [Chitinophaga pendula]
MNILLTAATILEIAPFTALLQQRAIQITDNVYKLGDHHLTVLIAGIGMMPAAWSLGKYFAATKPDIAIQAGIAGSFRTDWPLGKTLAVNQEYLADLGAQLASGEFNDLFDMQLWQPDIPPFNGIALTNNFQSIPPITHLDTASAASVNTVTGTLHTRDHLIAKYHPDLESMEGAAFHYACLMDRIPFLQIRTISNYVEQRDRSKWNIPLAVRELNQSLSLLFQTWNIW